MRGKSSWTPSDQRSVAQRRRALEQAYRRYREADCEVRALDISFAEVELEHLRENLASVRALRADDIASQQQVILAEYDVDLMLKQLEQAQQRAARCEREIAELGQE